MHLSSRILRSIDVERMSKGKQRIIHVVMQITQIHCSSSLKDQEADYLQSNFNPFKRVKNGVVHVF